MMQIIEQTYEEKLAMYMKCSKKELAQMLIQCNEIISRNLSPTPIPYSDFKNQYCQHSMLWVQGTGGGFLQCRKCGYTPSTVTFTTGETISFIKNGDGYCFTNLND